MKRRIINHNLKIHDENKIPIDTYPFMQMKRNSYLSLNGSWSCYLANSNSLSNKETIVNVPSSLKGPLSNFNLEINSNSVIVYQKEFLVEENFIKDISNLVILGIDSEYDIYLNDVFHGHYVNLSTPRKILLTSLKVGLNKIRIVVSDHNLKSIPHGKQSLKPKGMFYTSVEGIYFPIFIESLKKNHVRSLKIDSNLNHVTLHVDSPIEYQITIKENDKIVYQSLSNEKINIIAINHPHLWNFNDPFLYTLIIESEDDYIESYFGMRTIHIDKKTNYIYLNNKRIFINGLLDQGYYLDGILTPKSYSNYLYDILKIKELGFNAIRKHIKIECDYFYYLCDKLGILVIQDIVNNGKYHFFKETLMPTIFPFYQRIAKESIKSKEEKYYFLKHTRNTMNYLYNHPSIIMYTIFNEGWGQFKSDHVYRLVKKYDSTRIIDTTSGWFRKNNSDLLSLHIYFRDINKIIKKQSKVAFISEFGGYVLKIKDHLFNLNNSYGYKNNSSQAQFETNLYKLYHDQILKNIDLLSGAIYTQLSDVEDELNGILTYDRKVCKVSDENLIRLLKEISNYPNN